MRPILKGIPLPVASNSKAQLSRIENYHLVPDTPDTLDPGRNELTDEGKEALQHAEDFLVTEE